MPHKRSDSQADRIVSAFLISPLAFAASVVVGMFFVDIGLWWLICGFALLAYSAAMAAGMPSYLLYRKLKWNGWVHYLLSAIFVSGALVYFFVVYGAPPSGEGFADYIFNPVTIFLIFIFVVGPISTVAAFWLIARPDKIAA